MECRWNAELVHQSQTYFTSVPPAPGSLQKLEKAPQALLFFTHQGICRFLDAGCSGGRAGGAESLSKLGIDPLFLFLFLFWRHT